MGLVVVSYLIVSGKRNRNNTLLGLSLFCIWYSLCINQLVTTQEILRFPYLFRTGNITAYLILPFLYLYVRNGFYPGNLFNRYDWIFFVPAILYVIDMFPFFLMPLSEKSAILKNTIADPGKIFQISEGWIGIPGFHPVFRYVWSLSLLFLLFRVIYRNRSLFNDNRESGNLPILFFKLALALLYLPLIVPGFYGVFFHSSWYNLNFISFCLSLSLLATTLFLLLFPEVLNGFIPSELFRKNISDIEGYAGRSLHLEKLNPLKRSVKIEQDLHGSLKKIEKLVQERKLFKNPKYSVHHLANDILIPPYQLSMIINNRHNNFTSWLNQLRIDYYIEMSKNAEHQHHTIDNLRKEAGFSNRASFFFAFKKITGMSPADFNKTK